MTRDELEAVIRRELTRRDREKAQHDGTYADNGFTDRILTAADSYATTTGGITAERRADLAPVIHWQKPSARLIIAACHGRRTTARVTGATEKVTCGTCRESRAWKLAHAVAVTA